MKPTSAGDKMKFKFKRELHAFLLFMVLVMIITLIILAPMLAYAGKSVVHLIKPEEGLQSAHRFTLAHAIESAGRDRWERAMLLSIGESESKWSPDICDGVVLGDKGRAFGCWQSWHPDRSGGYEGQANRAIRHLRWGRKHCGSWEGAVAIYATGNRCEWSGAKERVELAAKYARRL